MEVTKRVDRNVVILTLTGRLVLEDVDPQLRATLDESIQQGFRNVVMNMRDVSYIDSAGLGFLVSKYVSLHRRGGDIALVALAPRVRHVLDITRLSRVFRTFETVGEAVLALERAAGAGVQVPTSPTTRRMP
jgi:anti-sigma B factor antagonist